MNKLIVTNTYYQLIVAIQLRSTMFPNEKVFLIVTDHSNNARKISNKLRSVGVFDQVIYVGFKEMVRDRSVLERAFDVSAIGCFKHNRYSNSLKDISDYDKTKFDEILCFNLLIEIFGIYAELSKYTENLRISLFEEGPLSYDFRLKKSRGQAMIDFAWRIQGKPSIFQLINRFYCIYPHLYRGSMEVARIPRISNESDCANTLRSIFELSDNKLLYPERYIFFSGVYDFEGGASIGEYELVCKIANLVGKENLRIKTHPRDARNIYKDRGFKVDENSNIPWEAIQLSGDFKDKIFLTATSSSVLAGSFMAIHPTKTFFLFKLCDMEGNNAAKKIAKSIQDLLADKRMKETLNRVLIVEKIEEIIS